MTNPGSLRYFAYLRKSTDERERQVRSLDDQRAELLELAERQNLHIVEILSEKQTAMQPGRPVFGQMLERMRHGEANAILAWHPDRLARNSVDGGTIIHLIDQRVIQTLTFVSHWFEPTPQGKFTLSMAFGQSKYYVDNLSEVVKRSHRQKLAAGLWPIQPPLGYLHNTVTKGIIPDPSVGPLITQLFERYAVGDITQSDLAKVACSWGLRTRWKTPLMPSRVHDLLTNPIYMGVMRFNGELYPGTHEPLVSPALFEHVQNVRVTRCRPRRNPAEAAPHPFRGMFRCGECGCQVTMETQKGHLYLRCTKKKGPCSQRYVRAEVMRGQVIKAVRACSLPEAFADRVFTQFLQDSREHQRRLDQRAQELAATIRQREEQLTLLNRRSLEGDFTRPEYLELKNPLLAELATLRGEFEQASGRSRNLVRSARTVLDEAVQGFSLAQSENLEEQCRFLKRVGSNLNIIDRQLKLAPQGAWKTLTHYGPMRWLDCLPDRVSDAIEGDFLIGAGTDWLLEPATEGAVPLTEPPDRRLVAA